MPTPRTRPTPSWVLPAVAVAGALLLPTLCLVWFMVRAMENEQMAVRQKLAEVFAAQLEAAYGEVEHEAATYLDEQREAIRAALPDHPAALRSVGDGVIVYEETGRRVYPPASLPSHAPPAIVSLQVTERPGTDAPVLIEAYRGFTQDTDPLVSMHAWMGLSRLARAAGEEETAREALERVAHHAGVATGRQDALQLAANARLALLEMEAGAQAADAASLEDRIQSILDIEEESGTGALLDPAHRAFLLDRLAAIAEGTPAAGEVAAAQGRQERVNEWVAGPGSESVMPTNRIYARVLPSGVVYASARDLGEYRVVSLMTPDRVEAWWAPLRERFAESGASWRILEPEGTARFGAGSMDLAAFHSLPLAGPFAGWRAELSFADKALFERTAARRAWVYLWTGTLVIFSLFAAGMVAVQYLRNQARMNRLKNDFIATVSHELKTPLSSLRMLTETLREGRYRDETQAAEYLELMDRENQRLTRLIENFLTFSRMERGKVALAIEAVRPLDLAEAAVDAMRMKAAQTGAAIELAVPAGLAPVLADRDAIATVLTNLIDNAIKHNPGQEKRVWVRAEALDPGRIRFSVCDNGPGLSARDRGRVFDRFYQADQRLSRSAEGCGLGLSIVKFIVEGHHGRVAAENRAGGGSCFRFTLPTTPAGRTEHGNDPGR